LVDNFKLYFIAITDCWLLINAIEHLRYFD